VRVVIIFVWIRCEQVHLLSTRSLSSHPVAVQTVLRARDPTTSLLLLVRLTERIAGKLCSIYKLTNSQSLFTDLFMLFRQIAFFGTISVRL